MSANESASINLQRAEKSSGAAPRRQALAATIVAAGRTAPTSAAGQRSDRACTWQPKQQSAAQTRRHGGVFHPPPRAAGCRRVFAIRLGRGAHSRRSVFSEACDGWWLSSRISGHSAWRPDHPCAGLRPVPRLPVPPLCDYACVAYDEGPATRLLDVLGDEGGLATKKMFGGLAILLVASRTPAACHRNNRRKHPRLRRSDPAIAEHASRRAAVRPPTGPRQPPSRLCQPSEAAPVTERARRLPGQARRAAVRRGIQPPAVGGEEVRQARAGDRACLPYR
jgi:hypothetical protein